MGFMDGALRMFPNWTWDVGGHTVAWNLFIPAAGGPRNLPDRCRAVAVLEQWATGDRAEHHVNDRPRNAPTRTAIGVAAVAFYAVFLLESAAT